VTIQRRSKTRRERNEELPELGGGRTGRRARARDTRTRQETRTSNWRDTVSACGICSYRRSKKHKLRIDILEVEPTKARWGPRWWEKSTVRRGGELSKNIARTILLRTTYCRPRELKEEGRIISPKSRNKNNVTH